MDPVRIDVRTASHAYAVTIAAASIDRLAGTLDALAAPARRFIVSSPLVWRLHGPQIGRALDGAEPILVPDGERFKQLATVARIYDALVRANADRASAIITFGGGVALYSGGKAKCWGLWDQVDDAGSPLPVDVVGLP